MLQNFLPEMFISGVLRARRPSFSCSSPARGDAAPGSLGLPRLRYALSGLARAVDVASFPLMFS